MAKAPAAPKAPAEVDAAEIARLQAQLAALKAQNGEQPAPPPPPPADPAAPPPEEPLVKLTIDTTADSRTVYIEDAGPPPLPNPEPVEDAPPVISEQTRLEMEAGKARIKEHAERAAAAREAAEASE